MRNSLNNKRDRNDGPLVQKRKKKKRMKKGPKEIHKASATD